MAQRFSIVTKTYHGDLNSFEVLCRTIDALMPDIEHHVLVDRSDFSLFQRFAGPRRKIVDATALLPRFLEFHLGSRRLWWRWPYYLARGWTFQQLAKIAYSSLLEDDAVLHVDSDMIFLRAATEGDVFCEGRARLFHNAGQADGEEFAKWHDVASRCLGLKEVGYTGFDYISNALVWSPHVVREMIARIESSTGRAWYDALIANFRFSEYIVYGVFCERTPGSHSKFVAPTDVELCHCSWHYDLTSEEGIDEFVSAKQPHHLGVLIQSNLGIPERQREAIFARFSAS